MRRFIGAFACFWLLSSFVPLAAQAVDDAPALDALVNDLSTPMPGRALAALDKLIPKDRPGNTGRFVPAVEPLLALVGVGGQGFFNGIDAESLLARIGNPALPAVLATLHSKAYFTQRAACVRLLTAIAPDKAAEVLPEYLADVAVRRDVVQALGQLGPAVQASAPKVEGYLEDSDPVVRARARGALVRITGQGTPHVEALAAMALAPKPNPDFRDIAVEELWSLGDRAKATYPVFIKAFSDTDPAIRGRAVGAFNYKGPATPEIVAGLVRVLEQDEVAAIRESAAGAIATIGPAAKVAIPTLAKGLDADVPGGWLYALALAGTDSEEALPALLRAMESRHEQTRITTAYCLYHFPGRAREIVPVLEKHAADPSAKVRAAVEQSLAILKGEPSPATTRATQP